MKNKKLISAILAAASIAGGVVGAQAADPQYEILNTKINSESQARVANDNLLNSRIDTNKANIQTNANHISDNNVAIQKEAAARRGDIKNVQFMAGHHRATSRFRRSSGTENLRLHRMKNG